MAGVGVPWSLIEARAPVQARKDWKGVQDLDFWIGDEAMARANEYSAQRPDLPIRAHAHAHAHTRAGATHTGGLLHRARLLRSASGCASPADPSARARRLPPPAINYPIRHGIVENWDSMERYWQRCMFGYLRCDPEVRRRRSRRAFYCRHGVLL